MRERAAYVIGRRRLRHSTLIVDKGDDFSGHHTAPLICFSVTMTKAALSIAYGAGLRGCEVVMLRVGDIDSERVLIRVEMGKGRKDRHAMLSPQLLSLLRAWWLQCRSRGWVFPARESVPPI